MTLGKAKETHSKSCTWENAMSLASPSYFWNEQSRSNKDIPKTIDVANPSPPSFTSVPYCQVSALQWIVALLYTAYELSLSSTVCSTYLWVLAPKYGIIYYDCNKLNYNIDRHIFARVRLAQVSSNNKID